MWELGTSEETRVETAIGQLLPPCQIACPIGEDIQRTNVLISLLPDDAEQAKEGIAQIGDYLYETNPLFTVCGYVCGLCERDCNYTAKGGAIRRRLLKRFLADNYMSHLQEKEALDVKKDKEKVAVIGGGPAGLMCAWELSKKGYPVTIFDSSDKLGGAVRYIPIYRLPANILDNTVENLVRIAGIDVEKKAVTDLSELTKQGYKAFFIATGLHYPRPLTFGFDKVTGQDLEGVEYGFDFLGKSSRGIIPADYYKGRKVIVIGGGNVAFDAARTARRFGGEVTVVCLENADKSSRDGMPADIEEIEGAEQENIKIITSRGVKNIIGEGGKFKKIECPLCTGVFDEKGFNPKFNLDDSIEIEGDVLLLTIGQMSDRAFLQNSGVLDEQGRLAIDTATLQSKKNQDVFIGGDIRKVGFAAEAMMEGIKAADSIDGRLRGYNQKVVTINKEAGGVPSRCEYKPQPGLKWVAPEERINFATFEIGFTLPEAISEAKRCITCGPCVSCKACVAAGIQDSLPAVRIREELCSGCGICVTACNYDAVDLKNKDGKLISLTDSFKCKACGMCVAACPAGARELIPDLQLAGSPDVNGSKGITCFYCKFGWGYLADGDLTKDRDNLNPVICIGKLDAVDILNAFKNGAEGVLLLGCGEGDCHFQDGNCEAGKKTYLLQKTLAAFGIAGERVKVVTSGDPRGTSINGLINNLAARIKNL